MSELPVSTLDLEKYLDQTPLNAHVTHTASHWSSNTPDCSIFAGEWGENSL